MEDPAQANKPSPSPSSPMDKEQIRPPKLTTADTESPEARAVPLLPSIDFIARTTAAAVLVFYALGFVILVFHDAKYGVIQFSPFRTRIVLVGFVFAMLVSLAAAAQHYGLSYFGPLEPVFRDSDPKRQPYREIILGTGFIFTATFISVNLGSFFLFLHSSTTQTLDQSAWHTSVIMIALYVIGLVVFLVASKIYLRKHLLVAILSLVAFIIVCIAFLTPGFSTPSSYLALMLTLVGWQTLWIKREKSPLRYALDFRNWYFVLVLLGIYISQIFSAMPPRWGGGQPTPIVVYLNSPAPWSSENPMQVLLLDETDQGLYVLRSPSGKAFYVPRSNVASVFFGTKDEAAKKP